MAASVIIFFERPESVRVSLQNFEGLCRMSFDTLWVGGCGKALASSLIFLKRVETNQAERNNAG